MRKFVNASRNTAKAKNTRKRDMLDEGDEYPSVNTSDESCGSADEDFNAGATDAVPDCTSVSGAESARSPASGSQILNTALAQAIERYEDRETTKLVRKEYEIVDSEDEDHSKTFVKKIRNKGKDQPSMSVDDAEYEFV